ncbi:MAG: PAS domain-containing protein [Proteobacteria bacterium]|nr:PAS domain-containing protein [Pseudomonadota bacterium]
MNSRNSKAELIAEIKALRNRLEELERSGNKAPLMQSGSLGRAEQRERKEGPQTQNILAAIPHGIVQIDLLGNILYANPAYHQFFEYDDRELIGTSIIDTLETDETRKLLIDFLAMLRTDQPLPTPYFQTRLTRTGRKIDVQVDFGYDRDGEGNLVSFTCVVTDITERIQVDVALQDSRVLLDSYIATAPVGMAVFDSEMRYINVNRSLADINGVSIENHIHKRPRDILPASLGLAVEKRFRNLLRTGQPIINEEISGETLSEPGVTRHWLHSYFPILGAGQKPKGIGVTVTETTRIKNAEEQLRQSQKMEALGTLSGGIAHDFNNILYPIFIYTNLLLEKFDTDSEEYADLKEIISAAQRAKDLVSQVLMFSRRSENVKHVCDLVPVVKEAMKLIRAALPTSITIETKIPDGIVPVFCDSSQLYQVLVNVCNNAGQAISGSGKVEIALDSSEVAGIKCLDGAEIHGNYCRLTVTDSGVGMDDETQAKIFDPFFSTREVGQGTGLGLSTVFGIIQEHGGGIKVSSETDKGTTFEVFLPLAEGPVEKLPDTRGSVQDYAGTENILFVDDEKSIRNLGHDCLGRFGYIVTAVSNGQQAMEIFAENPDHFNLVVTDQTMPNMSGEKLANALLKLRPDIPIIICTGYSSTTTTESSKALGISAFLQKPLEPTQLMRVVREVLDQAKNSA